MLNTDILNLLARSLVNLERAYKHMINTVDELPSCDGCNSDCDTCFVCDLIDRQYKSFRCCWRNTKDLIEVLKDSPRIPLSEVLDILERYSYDEICDFIYLYADNYMTTFYK